MRVAIQKLRAKDAADSALLLTTFVGHESSSSLSPYAAYLDERIRIYRELKHDVIRSTDGASSRSHSADGANRLRKLKVEKGLLREVVLSQRVLSRILNCAFFQENLSDDLNLSAFRMILKDILALYTAVNEGVINILEHYFEMSHPDASRSLEIYQRFCRHTEKVVAYLNAARKASYSLNMTVPQLKHAPVSLAGALEEYLKDPYFEKNRREYRESKRVADGLPPSSSMSSVSKNTEEKAGTATSNSTPAKRIIIQEPSAEQKTRAQPVKPPTKDQAVQDFFSTLERDLGPSQQAQSQQSAAAFGGSKPYSMMPQASGMSWFGSPDPRMGFQSQMTGFNPFLMQQQPTEWGGPALGSMGMMGPQSTGFVQQQSGFLQFHQTAAPMQSQVTGFNPFRQSMMLNGGPSGTGGLNAQMTGLGPSGAFDATPFTLQVRQQLERQKVEKEQREQQQQEDNNESNAAQSDGPLGPSPTSPPPNQQQQQQLSETKRLMPQKTGSRNPFAPPPEERSPTPPTPKPTGLTLKQLALEAGGAGLDGPTQGGGGNYGLGAGAWQDESQKSGQANTIDVPSCGALHPQAAGFIGSVASEFTTAGRSGMNGVSASPGAQSPQAQTSESTSANPNGATSALSKLSLGPHISTSRSSSGDMFCAFASSPATSATSPLLGSQLTGFGGSLVRPFKPESSFGTSLTAQSTSFPASSSPAQGSGSLANPFGLNSQATASPWASNSQSQLQTSQARQSSLSVAVPSQLSGYGSSLFTSNLPQSPAITQPQQQQGLAAQTTGFGGSTVRPFVPQSGFGLEAFGGHANGSAGQQQQQPNLLQF